MRTEAPPASEGKSAKKRSPEVSVWARERRKPAPARPPSQVSPRAGAPARWGGGRKRHGLPIKLRGKGGRPAPCASASSAPPSPASLLRCG